MVFVLVSLPSALEESVEQSHTRAHSLSPVRLASVTSAPAWLRPVGVP